MENNWSVVYTHSLLYNVEIAKTILEDNNINSVIINRKDSNYMFGEIELFVCNDDLEDAKKILETADLN